ncbi:MAG: hypothetical protein WA810_06690 [Maribacter sp.]
METNKFEQYIKSRLKERELEPSSKAWERIAGQLQPLPKSKSPYRVWMGIAASLLIVITISLFYLEANHKASIEEPVLVDSKKESSAPKYENGDLKTSDTKAKENVTNQEEGIAKKFETERNRVVGVDTTTLYRVGRNSPGLVFKDTNTSNGEAEFIVGIDEKTINEKVEEVLNRVHAMERSNAVTDAEVDSLLKQAQQDILREQIFKTDASVDAMALLNEVEGELDQSFRDQIFNSLKAGFIKVRTAVADRNN